MAREGVKNLRCPNPDCPDPDKKITKHGYGIRKHKRIQKYLCHACYQVTVHPATYTTKKTTKKGTKKKSKEE